MPVYQYEAMDNTGTEVKDTIEAGSEAEAQQKIKEQGFFVTKISEKGRGGKKKDAQRLYIESNVFMSASTNMMSSTSSENCIGRV